MNYTLAKQLKDAGFPQKHFGKNKPFDPSEPTLSELIWACGVRVVVREPIDVVPKGNPLITTSEPTATAYRPKLFLYQDENYKWSAFNGEPYSDGFIELPQIQSYGTPEEAVALLWLELNKRKAR